LFYLLKNGTKLIKAEEPIAIFSYARKKNLSGGHKTAIIAVFGQFF
jgi:hypothetical protein